MRVEDTYEIRIKVKTLTEASKVIQILDAAGYKGVEMGPPREHFHPEMFARMVMATRGHFNRMILRALYRLGAVDEDHGVDIDKVIEEMRRDPESSNLARCSSEGILSRTVRMVTHAILVEKHGWVSYDRKQIPRKFWLTEKGIEKSKSR